MGSAKNLSEETRPPRRRKPPGEESSREGKALGRKLWGEGKF
jgi:hypothetical protein